MDGRVPPRPCQNPSPGPRLEYGHAEQGTLPRALRTMRPSRGGHEGPLGQRHQDSAGRSMEEHGTPGVPKSHVAPGAKMPPNASPKIHTTRPQPALAAPPNRDQRPRGATMSQRPRPSWIQTADDAARIGWLDQMLTPELDDVLDPLRAMRRPRAGARSTGAPGAWPIAAAGVRRGSRGRRSRCAGPSGAAASGVDVGRDDPGWSLPEPWSLPVPQMVRMMLKAMAQTAPMRNTTRSWWSSSVWNAETMTVLPFCGAPPIPGMRGQPSPRQLVFDPQCTARRIARCRR